MGHRLAETGKWAFTLFVLLPLAALALLVIWAVLVQVPDFASSLYHSTWIRAGILLLVVAGIGGAALDRG